MTLTDVSKGSRIHGASLLAGLLLGNTLVHADVPVNGRSQEPDFTSEAVPTITAADYAKQLQRFERLGLLDGDTQLLA